MLHNVLKDQIGRQEVPIAAEALSRAPDLHDEFRHEEAIEILASLIDPEPDCVNAPVGACGRGPCMHRQDRDWP